MKRLMIAALLAGQLSMAAQSAAAAELGDARLQDMGRSQQIGTFAGLRMRVALGDDGDRQRLRAGLALAPTVQSAAPRGEVRTRFGEGLELGIVGDSPVRLSLAGTPVSQLAQGPRGPDGQRAGVSTIGWVAIGVGVAAITLFALYGLCGSGEICNVDDD
jgi:hypothetical protein